MAYFKSFLISLTLLSLLVASESATTISGTIERVTKQHILSTVPPGATADTPQHFLTSPSGRYVASFVRSKTAPGAGGFGNDFCYILVEDTSTSQSEWESECAPVTDANACTLAFTDDGLEVFDGSRSVWSTEADGNHVEVLTLVDRGDMRIVDKDGELAWRASDDARANQGCGLAGSEGLAPESPPFAGPIGGGNGPFGQPGTAPQVIGQRQQPQIVADLTQAAVAPVANGQQQTVGASLQSAAAAPPADEQQQTAESSPQSVAAVASPADEQQQTAAEDCPQSAAAVAPASVAPASDGQQQTAQEDSMQSAAVPPAAGGLQQIAGDFPVVPASNGQQQTVQENSTQSAAVPPAADGLQQVAEDFPQPAAAPAVDGQQQIVQDFPQPAATPAADGQQQTAANSPQSAVAPTVNQQQSGFIAQPLVDNSPFDSGSVQELGIRGGASSAVAAFLLVHALLHL